MPLDEEKERMTAGVSELESFDAAVGCTCNWFQIRRPFIHSLVVAGIDLAFIDPHNGMEE